MEKRILAALLVGNSAHAQSTGVVPNLWTQPVDNLVDHLGITWGQRVEKPGILLTAPTGAHRTPIAAHTPCGREIGSELGRCSFPQNPQALLLRRSYLSRKHKNQVVGAPPAAGANTASSTGGRGDDTAGGKCNEASG